MSVRRVWCAVALLGAALPVQALDVDLLISPADWTFWGAAGSGLGYRVAIGDVTGDGEPDLVVTAPWGVPPGDRVCIFPGPIAFPAELDLSVDTPPIVIDGAASSGFGYGLSLGDLDGDGILDLVVGAESGGPDGTRIGAGSVAVFRGRRSWPARLIYDESDWLVHGVDPGDKLNYGWVGDLDGDGAADLTVMAIDGDGPTNSRSGAGDVHILFGPATSWPNRERDLAVAPGEVVIYGGDVNDHVGNFELGLIADVLGDPTPDLLLGAIESDGPGNSRPDAGELFVLAGRSSWPSVLDLANFGAASFVVQGARAGDKLGTIAVADWDGDGETDVVVSASRAPTGTLAGTGATYLLRGRSRFSGTWDLLSRPADGMVLGPAAGAAFGWTSAVGDVDGDGRLDLIGFSTAGRAGAGGMAVVSGCDLLGSLRDLAVDPPELTVIGARDPDSLGDGSLAVGDVDGDGRADLFAGGPFSRSKDGARPMTSGLAAIVRGRSFDAPCSISADAGAPREICLGESTTLSAAASSVVNCSAVPEFRWSAGRSVIRDWSADPRVLVAPAAGTRYRVDLRCGDCASGTCTGSATVAVTVDPDQPPGDLGNTLRGARQGANVDLAWGTHALARSYVLHRGDRKGVWPALALRSGLALPRASEPDVPGPPPLHFYRAAAASCSGREGP